MKQRAERKGRNPHTKEEITIKASKAVSFKAAAALKTALNGCEEEKAEAKKSAKKDGEKKACKKGCKK